MKLEELMELYKLLNKEYYCALLIPEYFAYETGREYMFADGEEYAEERFLLSIEKQTTKLEQINRLLDTDGAVKYFESLTERFLYYLSNFETDEVKLPFFHVTISPRFFYEKSLIDEADAELLFENDEEDGYSIEVKSDRSRVLKNKVKVQISIGEIEEYYPDICTHFGWDFTANFKDSSSTFLVDYEKFVLQLMELGYKIEPKTFEELFEYARADHLELGGQILTTIHLEQQKGPMELKPVED